MPSPDLSTAAETGPVSGLETPCVLDEYTADEADDGSDDVINRIFPAESTVLQSGSMAPMYPKEMIREQFRDPFCTEVRSRINAGAWIPFALNDQGYIIWTVRDRP